MHAADDLDVEAVGAVGAVDVAVAVVEAFSVTVAFYIFIVVNIVTKNCSFV